MSRRICVAAALTALSFPLAARAQAPHYQVLARVAHPSVIVEALNESGDIAGYLNGRPFYTVGATVNTLNTINGIAHDIDNAGNLVGANNAGPGFFYDGTVHPLPPLNGLETQAWAINEQGEMAGSAGGGNNRAFFYDGTMHDIGTLGGPGAYANDLNELGHVVGSADRADTRAHAFLYDGTTMHDLGDLGFNFSNAYAVNDSDWVTGESRVTSVITHAFLHDGTTMQSLGTLGGLQSAGFDINSVGHVVGVSNIGGPGGNGDAHAFYYSPASGMIDLNSRIDAGPWVLNSATAINEAGQIAGVGTLNGVITAFVMNPVPEPATAALAAGVAVVLALRRRRQGRR